MWLGGKVRGENQRGGGGEGLPGNTSPDLRAFSEERAVLILKLSGVGGLGCMGGKGAGLNGVHH